MDYPEADIAAISPAMGIKGKGRQDNRLTVVLATNVLARLSPGVRVIHPKGTPYRPQNLQVEGGGQKGPSGSGVVNTSQQKPYVLPAVF